jgi:MFS family permease
VIYGRGIVNESRVRAVVAACTTTTACVFPVFLVGGVAVQMGAELHFSPAGLGGAIAVYFAVSAFASVPAGRIVERFGPTGTSRAAIVLATVCLLGTGGLAHSYPLFVVLLAFGGLGNALGQLASNSSLALHVRAGRQGFSFGVKQTAVPLSQLLAGASVPVVALTVGWRWAFVAGALVALLAVPLVPSEPRTAATARRAATDPRRTAPRPRRAADDPTLEHRADADPTDSDRDSHPAERGTTRGRGTGALVVMGAAGMLAAGSAGSMGSFLVAASAGRGLDPGLAGLTLSLGGAICVVARLLAGWLADRRTSGHVGMMAAMLAVGAVGVALLAVPGEAALVAGVVLGFGLGWAWPGLLNFAVVRLHPQAPAAATSITQTGVYAGGGAGPLTFGLVAAAYGYPTAWLCGSVAMLGAAGLMVVGSRALSRRGPAPVEAPV